MPSPREPGHRVRMVRSRPPGHTLPEVLLALTVAAVLTSLLVPPARRTVDRVAVDAARDRVAGLFLRARAAARARGGSSVEVDAPAGEVRLVAADGWRAPPVLLRERFGVEVDAGLPGGVVRLAFDPLGIGRMASRTLRLRRGGAATSLVISSYGRVRAR